jgi:6-phosphogluconolactonase (cycloisomerase 2 family)
LTFTSSTFAEGAGPQAGDSVATDCNFEVDTKRLSITADGITVISQAADSVVSTLAGVVYVGSNIGEGANSIFAFRRDSTGALTALPGSPFLTGGSGVTVDMVPTIGPFDSDQNVIVNAEHTRLFAVNPGSDTIAVFDILPDGGLVPVAGSPFASGGINPVSLGLAEDRLYVVNMNFDPRRPDVTAANFPNYTGFTVAEDGTLTPIPGSTVSLTSATAVPTQALISRDNSLLFSTHFFAGELQSFQIEDDGTLVQNSPLILAMSPQAVEFDGGDLFPVEGSPFPSGGVTPMSIGIAGNFVYVVNNNRRPLEEPLPTFPNYTGFTLDPMTGSLTPIPGSTITLPSALQNPSQALISPDGNFLFGADVFGPVPGGNAGRVRSFRIEADGLLTPVSSRRPPASAFTVPTIANGGTGLDLNGDGATDRTPLGLAVHPTEPILYVGFASSQRLGVYTYDTTGALTFVRSVDNSGIGICWILSNAEGTRLYTTNSGDDTLSVYDIGTDPLHPVEIQIVEAKGNGSDLQLAISEDEAFLYLTKQRAFQDDLSFLTQGAPETTPLGEGGHISVFRINEDGTVTEVESSPTMLDVPGDPFTRPHGVATIHNLVYAESNIPGQNMNSIFVFSRDADGNLTELSNSPFPTEGAGLASNPNTLPMAGPFDADQIIVIQPDPPLGMGGRPGFSGRLFAVNPGSNSIAVFDILRPGVDFNMDGMPDTLPLGLQVHPTEPILYVGYTSSRNKVAVYRYDETGQLEFVRTALASGAGVCWMVTNSAGTRLYTTNTGDDTVSVFDISDPENPVEIQLVQLRDNGNPFQLTISPDGDYLYVVKQRDFEVDFAGVPTPPGEGSFLSVLSINPADGTLTEVDSSPQVLDVPAEPITRPQGVAAL